MNLTAEISMYPFNEDFKPLIRDFIARLNTCDELQVSTSPTSTIVHGEFNHVMETLTSLMAWSFETHGRAVFVTKFIPGHEL